MNSKRLSGSRGVWVERKDVEGQPHDLSLTNEMMVVFREGREPLGYRYAVRD